MTDRTEILDAAIVVAEKATEASVQPNTWMHSDNRSHDYARALITHIADHMSRHITAPMVWMGYSIALDDLREIAGIEPEKVYDHNDGN